jgi:hypothetical protein
MGSAPRPFYSRLTCHAKPSVQPHMLFNGLSHFKQHRRVRCFRMTFRYGPGCLMPGSVALNMFVFDYLEATVV